LKQLTKELKSLKR